MIDIDWGTEWVEAQKRRRRADDSSYWDRRAPSFAKTAGSSPYVREFLELAGVKPGETVFDMGCGSGTLALPLARSGHEVWACDFSKAMLDLMMEQAEAEGISDRIHAVRVAWDGDWQSAGIPVCDLAFASRSIATDNLRSALGKLAGRAGRRVCLTLATDTSPRSDEVLLRAVGREREEYPDFVFGMNILWQMGLYPDLTYIRSARSSTFESFEEAIDKTCEIIEATPSERERLIAYSQDHLHETRDEAGNVVWAYDHVRVTSWAFISWNK